jgi:cytochrome P450
MLITTIYLIKDLDDLDIVSQAFTFFLGGFETVATAMSYASLALAAHPEIQDRLRAEVDAAFQQSGGTITYEAVQNLKYMDMVLSGNVILCYKYIIIIY